jgi:hypothetical protein
VGAGVGWVWSVVRTTSLHVTKAEKCCRDSWGKVSQIHVACCGYMDEKS